MADPSHHPGTSDDTDVRPDRGSPHSAPPRAPRWVKVSAIIVGVLILLVLITKLTGLGGDHGPGRHTGTSGTPLAGVTEVQATSVDNSGGHAPAEGDD